MGGGGVNQLPLRESLPMLPQIAQSMPPHKIQQNPIQRSAHFSFYLITDYLTVATIMHTRVGPSLNNGHICEFMHGNTKEDPSNCIAVPVADPMRNVS